MQVSHPTSKMAIWKVGSQGGYVLSGLHIIVCVHHPLYTLSVCLNRKVCGGKPGHETTTCICWEIPAGGSPRKNPHSSRNQSPCRARKGQSVAATPTRTCVYLFPLHCGLQPAESFRLPVSLVEAATGVKVLQSARPRDFAANYFRLVLVDPGGDEVKTHK